MALTTLTQGHLKLLDLCHRRLQYTYLDQLAAPEDPEMLERQRWGTRFHLAMQQREMGLSLDALLAQDPELANAIRALEEQAPDWFGPTSNPAEPELLRQSEHRRSLAWGPYELTVVYDLLRLTPHSGHIIDWKTYRQRPRKPQLAKDWQTRLYLYVLAETTDLDPAQLSMTYWFVPPPAGPTERKASRPGAVTLTYSQSKHRATTRDLKRLITHLDGLLATQDFRKVDAAKGHCSQCPFALRCQRTEAPVDPLLAPVPNLETIAEIPL